MRVGLLIYGDLETVSGGYLYDRMLVDTLQRAGDEVSILSLSWRNYLQHLGDNFSAGLAEKLLKLDVDVMLQDELNHPSLFWLNSRLRSRLKYPLVTIVHHLRCSELRPAWQNRFYARVERGYLATLDGFIFNSQTTRNAVSQVCPEAEHRPQVIAYPAGDRFESSEDRPVLSDEALVQRAHQPGPLRLVFLGNLIPRKGLHVLLDAMHLLSAGSPGVQPALTLAVVGRLDLDPAYTHLMQQRVEAYGMQEQVSFFGYLDQPELAAQLRQAQVLALPSSYEGFGIAYLEGMSFGLPALASRTGAAGEIISDGIDGYLLPPEAPQALADCLSGLERDRSRLASMSLAARQRFCSHPGWQQTGQVIRQFLQIVSDGWHNHPSHPVKVHKEL